MSAGNHLNPQQFSDDLLVKHLGREALSPYDRSDSPHRGLVPNSVPAHVFRTMSEEHYQQSLRTGWHQSDERGNYLGQAKADPEMWEGETPEPEGTVAGRWAYPGYAQGGVARIAKIATHPDEQWEVHPDDEERGYIRTFKPIPVSRFSAVTPPFRLYGAS